MRKLIAILGILLSTQAFAKDYTVKTEKETWSSLLLFETCPQKLQEAISYVKSENKDTKLLAYIPETVGYKYFDVIFEVVKTGVKFGYHFDYSTKNDHHQECTGVEPRSYDE